tara:strand:- start:1424 stop:2143 length:720 start_codon:yes stop_codon:yes gene_type:complete
VEKNFKIKSEKKIFYSKENVVNNYDYKRFKRGGGKYVKKTEDKVIENFLKYINLKNPSVVDCPSGTGRILPILKKYSKKIICIDNSMKMIKFSKKNFSNYTFVKCSADNLSLKKNSVDIFLSLRFLFHFNDVSDFFEESSRVIKKNGYYIFDTFNWSPRTLLGNKYIGGKTYNHGRKKIEEFSKKNGFKIIHVNHCFFIPTYISTFLPNFFVTSVEFIADLIFVKKFRTKSFYLLKKIK